MTTYPLEIKLTELKTDPRPYKPGSPTFVMDITVVIDIPINQDYMTNSDAILIAQLSSDQSVPYPKLKPKGVRFIIDELENVLKEKQSENDDTYQSLENDNQSNIPTNSNMIIEWE